MKRISKIFALLAVASLLSVESSKAQLVVKFRPNRPGPAVVVRTGPPPSPRHVWVAEEWTPNGGRYAYRPAHWEVPARPGAVWIPGHWSDRRGGTVWVPGHWR